MGYGEFGPVGRIESLISSRYIAPSVFHSTPASRFCILRCHECNFPHSLATAAVHSTSFLQTPKASLEFALRSFTALTEGDHISIEYGGSTFAIIVQEIKPSRAACVVNVYACPIAYNVPTFRNHA